MEKPAAAPQTTILMQPLQKVLLLLFLLLIVHKQLILFMQNVRIIYIDRLAATFHFKLLY